MEDTPFSTIGNITRVRIMACLGQSDKTVSELIANCALSQSAVSQHLAYLKRAGLISSTKRGRYRIYQIADHRLATICTQILKLFPELIKCN